MHFYELIMETILIRKFISWVKKRFFWLSCYFIRQPTDSTLSPLAVTTGSITAVIRQIPNQPIRFWVCWWMSSCVIFFCLSRMSLVEIVLKMKLLVGHGKSILIWMVVIQLFFFNYQWLKFDEKKQNDRFIFISFGNSRLL